MRKFEYDWKDPQEPTDTCDRFTRDAEGPLPTSDEDLARQRGRPFTDAELAGVLVKRYETQPARKPRLPQSLLIKELKKQFDPLAGAQAWLSICSDHLDKIKPRSTRNIGKAARAKAIVAGVLMGATFTQIAAELQIDKAVVSRTVRDLRDKHPDLERALGVLSTLNRTRGELVRELWRQCGEVSTLAQVPHSGEAEKTDGDACAKPSIDDPVAVKLLELHGRVFRPQQSSFSAQIGAINAKVDCGSWRVEKVEHDWRGYEVSRADYRAPMSPDDDHDPRHDALQDWFDFRKLAGLSAHDNIERIGWREALQWAEQFFRDKDREPVEANYPDELPLSLLEAPWINPGYLAPEQLPRPRHYTAPYIPRINNCPPAKKIVPLRSFKSTGSRHQPFSSTVLNNGRTTGVNERYNKIVGHGPHSSGSVDQVHPGTKLKLQDYLRGRIFHDHPNRCAVFTDDRYTAVKKFTICGRLRSGGIAQKVGSTMLRFEMSHRKHPVGAQWQCAECAPFRAF